MEDSGQDDSSQGSALPPLPAAARRQALLFSHPEDGGDHVRRPTSEPVRAAGDLSRPPPRPVAARIDREFAPAPPPLRALGELPPRVPARRNHLPHPVARAA